MSAIAEMTLKEWDVVFPQLPPKTQDQVIMSYYRTGETHPNMEKYAREHHSSMLIYKYMIYGTSEQFEQLFAECKVNVNELAPQFIGMKSLDTIQLLLDHGYDVMRLCSGNTFYQRFWSDSEFFDFITTKLTFAQLQTVFNRQSGIDRVLIPVYNRMVTLQKKMIELHGQGFITTAHINYLNSVTKNAERVARWTTDFGVKM